MQGSSALRGGHCADHPVLVGASGPARHSEVCGLKMKQALLSADESIHSSPRSCGQIRPFQVLEDTNASCVSICRLHCTHRAFCTLQQL